MKETPLKDQAPAQGHVCKINRFDEATVMLPLNIDEARRLSNMVRATINRLEATNDFPERAEYDRLATNLTTAYWMLTQ